MKIQIAILSILLVLSILLLVGCTKTTTGVGDLTPSPTVTQTTSPTTVQTTVTTTPLGGDCDPRATPIDYGEPVHGTMLASEPFHEYCLYSGACQGLIIELNYLTSNFELYVGYDIYLEEGDKPDWLSKEPNTDDEWIGIISPDEGYYYIQVYNIEGVTGVYVLTVDTGELI